MGKPGHRSCARRQARKHRWGHVSASSRVTAPDLGFFFGAGPPDSEEGVDMGKAQLHLRGWLTRQCIGTES